MLKKLSCAFVGLIAAAGIAVAGGAFQGYPLVGGDGTQCLSFGNGAVCNQFWPAGPSVVTGSETIPADTNVQGAGTSGNPSTEAIPLPALGAGPSQYVAPLTGATVTATNLQRRVVLDPAGTIAALTVVFPAVGSGASALVDGQLLGLCSTQVVTALTLTAGSGTTIKNGVTALAIPPGTGAGTCYEWTYVKAQLAWYRVQ